MKITDALRAEHRIFLNVFKQIEEVLPSLVSPLEIQTMARVVESILRDHAQRETQMALLAFDSALEEQGTASRMHEEHREIDTRLIQVNRAGTCAEARRLLKAAIISSREHFAMEEKLVFPRIESILSPECLRELGAAWIRGEAPPSVNPALLAKTVVAERATGQAA